MFTYNLDWFLLENFGSRTTEKMQNQLFFYFDDLLVLQNLRATIAFVSN